MFSKTNVTLETCSRDVAKAFALMPALKGERPLRPHRLTFLRSCVSAGTFVSPTWAVVVDKATGVRYRCQRAAFFNHAGQSPGGRLSARSARHD